MVQADNDRRQQELDEVGAAPERTLNVNTCFFDIILQSTLISSNSSPYQASPIRNTNL